MLRTMSHATRCARSVRVVRTVAAAAAIALPVVPQVAVAQDTRPVVVVFTFDNNALGKDRADYDGMQKGVQDLLITDLASNPKIRLVDRARIAELLQEQNMVKSQQIDPATAIRLGKILGAQYAITGGFTGQNGNGILTGRTIDLETSAIGNGQKITGKMDDVLSMIGQLSSKLASDMKLETKPGRRVGDAGAAAKPSPAQSGTPATKSAPASSNVEQYARAVSSKAMQTKLDAPTLKLYSNALDEMDKKNNAKAATLFKQVLAKYPEFEPAQNQLKKVS